MNAKNVLNYIKQFIYTGLIVGEIWIYSGIELLLIFYILVGYITVDTSKISNLFNLSEAAKWFEAALYMNSIPFGISILMRIWNKRVSEIMILITVLTTGIQFIMNYVWALGHIELIIN